MKVELNEFEVSICQMIGSMRHLSNRANHIKDGRVGKQSALETDQNGVIGEYAFCKHFNLHFDFDVSTRSGSYDCKLNNKRIDIKTTKYQRGHIVATLKDNPDVDIYVMAILDGTTVTFPGWIEKENFINPANIKDLGHGKSYVLDQSQLKGWKNES